jgi:type IV pilus assembly protein PilB
MEAARSPWPALGVLLIRDGLVSPDDVEAVLRAQGDDREHRISSRRLGDALVERGLVTSAQVARLVAEQHELPFVDLDDPDSRVPVAARLDEELARRHSALPIRAFPDGSLLVVVADPTSTACFDDIRRALGAPVRFAVAAPTAIEAAIDSTYAREPSPTVEAVVEEETDLAEAELQPEDVQPVAVHAVPDAPDVPDTPWPVLGSLLLRDGLVSEEELEAALAQQRLSSTQRLGELLVARGALTEVQVAQALAEQHELPFVDLAASGVDLETASKLAPDVAARYAALPVSTFPDGSLLVAVADPASALHSAELQAALPAPARFAVGVGADIRAALSALEHDRAAAPAEEPIPLFDDTPAESDTSDEPEAPSIVMEAVTHGLSLGAASVHVTPRPDGLVVRARVEGVVTELASVPPADVDRELEAVEELASRPRLSMAVGERTVELRSTTLPTTLGRRVTLLVVEDETARPSLTELVEDAELAVAVQSALEHRSGLFVVCGPAGSGRTTTLYAAVDELSGPDRLDMTIEDPVERFLQGVDQTEVDPHAGVTFASGLTTILRSDPDSVVVGELFDEETARLALRGARSGHYVLTTLQAPTAALGIRRLLAFGLDPGALSAALTGVVAQQLVRRTCVACRQSYFATSEEIAALDRPPEEAGRRLLGRGRGCTECDGSGYRGRVAVFEALPLVADVRELVARGPDAAELEAAAVAAGMRTLRQSVVRLCLDGVTTTAELPRLAPQSAL